MVLSIAAGLAFQLAATRDRALAPDEALHFGLVNQPGVSESYQRARSNAHPPLFFLALHFWMRLGRSELFLRLLPSLFGAAFLWLAYRWTSRVLGAAAGFLSFLVMIFSPMWLPLSVELRHYSLMLMLSAAALLAFEKAAEKSSRPAMLLFFLFLYLAILTHYSALFIAVAVAVYTAIRLRAGRAPARIGAVWAAGQVGVAALYLWLYFTHIRGLRGSAMERWAMTEWLSSGYFHRDQESVSSFLVRQAAEVLRFFFGSAIPGVLGLVLALCGVAVLVAKRRPVAVLLVLPLLLGAAAGALGLYPFTGTRHSAYLLLFLAPAIGVALSRLVSDRLRLALLALPVFLLIYWSPPVWAETPGSRPQMNAAIDQLRRRASPGSLVFTDHRSGVLLSYYLGREEPNSEGPGAGDFWESNEGGFCVVNSQMWTPEPIRFGEEIERMVRTYGLPVNRRFWVVRVGKEFHPVADLRRRFPGARFPNVLEFGGVRLVEVWLVAEPTEQRQS